MGHRATPNSSKPFAIPLTAITQKCWTGAAENSIPRRSASTTSTPLCASSKLDRQDGLALTLTHYLLARVRADPIRFGRVTAGVSVWPMPIAPAQCRPADSPENTKPHPKMRLSA